MRINNHNTKINTNYGEVDVEFSAIWAIDQDGWYLSHVDIIDYDNDSITYDTIVNSVIEYANYNCDPMGGESNEEIDYVD
jgi:hypothetical protein